MELSLSYSFLFQNLLTKDVARYSSLHQNGLLALSITYNVINQIYQIQ